MSRSSEYWRKRTLQVEEKLNNKSIELYHELERAYNKASVEVEKEIVMFYSRFANENGISLMEAKRLLTTKELEEFRWNLADYTKHAKLNNPEWATKVENASLRYRISRLEALKISIQNQVEVLMGHELDALSHHMGNIYTEGYYRTAHMIQTGLGIGHSFAKIDSEKVSRLLVKPWVADGSNFSKRIWGKHRPELISKLHTDLTRSIIQGKKPDELIKKISKEFNVSKGRASNLVMTESAYFGNLGQQACYAELDVEKQQFCATLDLRTSEICREMDGKVFNSSDVQIGVNAPPLHCRCRSCMTPYFEGNVKERVARDPKTGKSVYIEGNLTYKEWYDQFCS